MESKEKAKQMDEFIEQMEKKIKDLGALETPEDFMKMGLLMKEMNDFREKW